MGLWSEGLNVVDRVYQQQAQTLDAALRYLIPGQGRVTSSLFGGYLANNATFNVKDYGAVGDGETDDTVAIQLAFDKAKEFGGKVYFPMGVFGIQPQGGLDYMLRLRPGIVLEGDGWCSRVKVLDTAGDYRTIFASDEPLVRVAIKWLVIDQNPSGNIGASIRGDIEGQQQFGFHLWSGIDMLEFDHVSADPYCGTNFIACGDNDAASGRVKISGGYLRFVKGFSDDPKGYYDNSAIYLDLDQQEVTLNTFVTTLADDAFGAIETHGGRSVIAHNTCVGYETLVNVVTRATGLDEFSESNIVVIGNTVRDCKRAVALWPLTGFSLKGVIVGKNTIQINNADRGATDVHNNDNYWGVGINWSTGGDFDGAIDGLLIAANIIRMQAEDRVYTAIGSDSITGGISLQHQGVLKNVRVVENEIIDSPKAGITVWARSTNTFERIDVVDNLIVDAGNNSADLSAYRSGLWAAGKLVDCGFKRNKIVDTSTGAQPNGVWAINGQSLDAASSNVQFHDNEIIYKSSVGVLTSDAVYADWRTPQRTRSVAGAGAIDVDASVYDTLILSDSVGGGFNLNDPLNSGQGQRLVVQVQNVSGGVMLVPTWGASFRLSADVQPADNKGISLQFRRNATLWIEEFRGAETDVT